MGARLPRHPLAGTARTGRENYLYKQMASSTATRRSSCTSPIHIFKDYLFMLFLAVASLAIDPCLI